MLDYVKGKVIRAAEAPDRNAHQQQAMPFSLEKP
jgi:hypothetical protein